VGAAIAGIDPRGDRETGGIPAAVPCADDEHLVAAHAVHHALRGDRQGPVATPGIEVLGDRRCLGVCRSHAASTRLTSARAPLWPRSSKNA